MPTLSRLEPSENAAVLLLRFSDPADPSEAPDNSFSPAFLDSLEGALDEIESSTGPAALVTIGAGKFYSTGLDLEIVGAGGDLGPYLTRVHKLFARFFRLELPTVAAINGHAFGAAAMLSLCHDIRLMRNDRGYWNLPEAKLGMWFPPQMNNLVETRLGHPVASTAMLTAHRYTAAEAVEAGIAHDDLDEDALLDAAVNRATELAPLRGANYRGIREGLLSDLITLLETPMEP